MKTEQNRAKVLILSHLWPERTMMQSPVSGIYVYEQVEEIEKIIETDTFIPARIFPNTKELVKNIFVHKSVFGQNKTDGNFNLVEKKGTILNYFPVISKHISSFIIASMLFTKLGKERYKIIHGHTLYPDGFAAYIYGKMTHTDFAITIHGSDLMLIHKRPVDKIIAKIFLKKAKKIIIVSSKMKDILKNDFYISDKVVIIKNGIKQMFNITDGEKNILFVGKLIDVKDPVMLLDSFEIFLKEHDDYKLLIAGDGQLRSGLEKTAKERGILPKIKFLGFVNREDIGKIYSQSSFLVITSKSEGFPTILFEAMSAGLPIVSFDVGGVKDVVIDDVTGFIVKERNKNDFASMMKKCAEKQWNRIEIRKFAENFTWKKIAKDIVSKVYI